VRQAWYIRLKTNTSRLTVAVLAAGRGSDDIQVFTRNLNGGCCPLFAFLSLLRALAHEKPALEIQYDGE
jgi:hypothetical protein